MEKALQKSCFRIVATLVCTLMTRLCTVATLLCAATLICCKQEQQKSIGVFQAASESDFDLPDIQHGGELIVLTLYGAQSYFEFQGEGFGLHYKLVEAYAKSIGCTVRVDVLRNPSELLERLNNEEGDIIAYDMPASDSLASRFALCGQAELSHFIDSTRQIAWIVRQSTPQLAQSVSHWLAANSSDFRSLTAIRVTDSRGRVYTPRRHVYSPIRDLAKGQISLYDELFRRYAMRIGWDWRLLAAQAYQESAFDPNAVSHMGAIGLMQLMPRTAQSVGVSVEEAFTPERSLQGAVAYIARLDEHYADIASPSERQKFILAAYNGGPGHVDDARALARKYDRNPDLWNGHVDQFIQRLSQPRYYNDPDVRYGYLRGTETYNYVHSILARWQEYRKVRN